MLYFTLFPTQDPRSEDFYFIFFYFNDVSNEKCDKSNQNNGLQQRIILISVMENGDISFLYKSMYNEVG